MNSLKGHLAKILKRSFAWDKRKTASQPTQGYAEEALGPIQRYSVVEATDARQDRGPHAFTYPTAEETDAQAPSGPAISHARVLQDTTANYRLPFDILTQIFDNLAGIEDAGSPLERILSVCHYWRDTALDHRPLWTTFRVRVCNYDDVRLWRDRLRERLKHCSPTALLDVTIELVNRKGTPSVFSSGSYDTGNRPRGTVYARAALGILKVFAGKHGVKATRWKTLNLDFLRLTGLTRTDEAVIDYFLQHRTPNLESLHLRGVLTRYGYSKTVFPYSPRLRKAEFHSCKLSKYPSMTCITSLTWYSALMDGSLGSSRAIHALATAQKLTYLEIGLDWTDWDIPILFPRLVTLMIPATVNPSFMIMIQVPSLRRLGFGLDQGVQFATIQDCKGIPCRQIGYLAIFYTIPQRNSDKAGTSPSYASILLSLKRLLAEMHSLHTISWFRDSIRHEKLSRPTLEELVGVSVPDELFQGLHQPTRNRPGI